MNDLILNYEESVYFGNLCILIVSRPDYISDNDHKLWDEHDNFVRNKRELLKYDNIDRVLYDHKYVEENIVTAPNRICEVFYRDDKLPDHIRVYLKIKLNL